MSRARPAGQIGTSGIGRMVGLGVGWGGVEWSGVGREGKGRGGKGIGVGLV